VQRCAWLHSSARILLIFTVNPADIKARREPDWGPGIPGNDAHAPLQAASPMNKKNPLSSLVSGHSHSSEKLKFELSASALILSGDKKFILRDHRAPPLPRGPGYLTPPPLIPLSTALPTSVEAVRAFSAAGTLCTKIRSRLSDATLDILLSAFYAAIIASRSGLQPLLNM